MKVGIIGGTGRIGALLVARAAGAGHEVLSVSRRGSEDPVPQDPGPDGPYGSEGPHGPHDPHRPHGPHRPHDPHSRHDLHSRHAAVRSIRGDITSASGLPEIVEECDIVYDLVDARTTTGRLVEGAQNLVAAARSSSRQPILVNLAIINAGQSSFGYYRSKTAQAEVYRSYVRGRVLEAAQFFSFMDTIFDAGRRAGVIPWLTGSSFQPVSESDVASELLKAADSCARPVWRLVGPEVLTAKDAAHRYRVSTRSRRILLPVRIPGAIGRFYRDGQHLDATAPIASIRYRIS